MSGPLPDYLWTNLGSLRHLYINNNRFGGSLPPEFALIGNSRLQQLLAHDNNFAGTFPGEFSLRLHAVEIQGAGFTLLDHDLCRLRVMGNNRGHLIALRTDCDICTCGSRMCRNCRRS